MKRTEFLRNALAGTSALFAAKWGTFAQIREYKQQEKPLLTAANLTRLFARSAEANNGIPFDTILADPKAFLHQNFSISPQQRVVIDKISEADWKSTKDVIQEIKKRKGKADFKFIAISEEGDCKTHIRLLKIRMNKGTNVENEVVVKEVVINSY